MFEFFFAAIGWLVFYIVFIIAFAAVVVACFAIAMGFVWWYEQHPNWALIGGVGALLVTAAALSALGNRRTDFWA